MDHIEMAREIAEAASYLDWIKSSAASISTETRIEAAGIVANLHRIAAQLAGDRAHEIYGHDDESETQAA